MPKYKVRGPDDFLYEFNGPADATDDEKIAYAQHLYDQRQTQITPAAGMGEAIKGGAKQFGSSVLTGLQGVIDPEAAAKAGLERQAAITERPGASLEKVKSVYNEQGLWPAAKEVVSEIPAAIAEQAPNLGATFAGARLGSMAGASFGPWGAGAGALLGAAVPSFFSQAGSNLERQAQEGKPVSRTSAFGAAAPQAAIDVFADKLAFGKLLGLSPAKLGTDAAEKLAGQSMKRVLATGVAKGIAAEVPGEVAQQMLERFQAGLPLTDDDARKEYANIMYQTSLLGPVGAVANVQERGAAREQYAQEQQQLQAELAAIDAERARQQAIVDEAQATANAVAAEESRKILADLDFRAQKLKEAEAISTAQPLRPLQEIIDEVNGVSTPRTKTNKASVEAALNEPSGQRVADPVTGIERELTMGELQDIQRPDLVEQNAHPTLDKTTLTSLVPNLTPQAGVYKRLLDLNVDSKENLAKLRGELSKLGDKYAVNETKLKEIEDAYKQTTAERKTAESIAIEPGRETVGAGVQDTGGLGRGVADTSGVAGPDIGGMDVVGSPVSEPLGGTSGASTTLNPYQQKLAEQRKLEEQARLEEKAANLEAAKAEQAAIAAQQATAEQRAAEARKVEEAQAQYDDAIQAAQEELPTVDERAKEPDVDIEKFEEAKDKFGTYLRQTFGNVKNIAPEDQISAGEALSALADIMYHIVHQGAKSTGHAIQQARKALAEKYGDVVKNITADQFNEAYTTAVNRRATEQVAPKAAAAKPTGPVKTRADGTPIKYSMAPSKSTLDDVRKVFNGDDNDWSAFADKLGALRDKIGLGVVSKRYTLERKALDKGIPAVSAKQQGVMRGDLIAQQADNAVALSHAGMIKGDLQILPSGMVQAQDADTNMMTISDGYRALVQQAAKDLGSEDLAYDMVSAGWNGPRYASLARKNAEIDAQIAALTEEKPAHWRAQVTALENDKAYIGDWTESDKKTAAEAERRYGPQLKAIKDQWNDFRGRLLTTMVDSGLYTQTQADAYLENMDYVPFYRLTEDELLDVDKMPRTGSSLRNLGKEFKLKGSEKTVADPLENLWANVSWMMQRAIKNNAALNLTSLLEQIGEGRFAESWSRNGHIGSLTDAEKKKLYHVVVSKDGEAKEFVLDDPNDMAAFSASPIITGAIWDLIGLPARGLRHGVTMMPQFVFNQAFEDPVRAAMVSGNKAGIMKNIKDTWTSIAKNQFTAEHSPGAEALYSAGVIGQKDIMSEQEVKDIYMGRNKQGWRKGLFFFERLAQGSDLGAREAIYNNAVEELVNEGYDRKTAESLALSRAIQYMPHQQVGTSRSLAYLRRMMPFVNSPIQGLARDVAAARGRISGVSKEEGKKRLAFRLAKYAAFTAMYAAFMSGDDDYENLTEDQKDNYFIIGGARIPAPQEIRPLKVLIERGTRAWVLNAPGADIESTDIAAASMKKAWELISGLAMPIPTAIRPVIENMTNYDIHSGRAVVGAGQSAREPAMQFTDGTSELAKSIGAAINYSPIKIDHLLSGYFGYAGQTVQNMTNMLASDRPAPSINELMFVGSIAAPEYGTGPKSEAYELLNKVAEVKATMKALREEGDAEKLREYMTKNRGYLGAEGMVNAMHTQITNIRRLQSMVAKSDMSPDEKRAKIDELKQNELASLSRVHEVSRMIAEANKEGS